MDDQTPLASAMVAPVVHSAPRSVVDNRMAEVVSLLETAVRGAEGRAEGIHAPVVFEPESDYESYGAELTGEQAVRALNRAEAEGYARGLKAAVKIARKVQR